MESDSGFDTVFTLMIVAFVVIVVISAVVSLMNYQKARSMGVNPLTMQTELEARIIKSQALAPEAAPKAEKTVEERLADIDALHAKGTITDAERAAARAAILRAP